MNKLQKALLFYRDVRSKKGYFPNKVLMWQLIGKYAGQMKSILGEKRTQKICDKRHKLTKEFLISEFSMFIESYKFKESNERNSKIIWSLWLQGEKNAPEIVKYTLDSIRKYANKNEFEFRLLDEKTMYDYIEFPLHVQEKINNGVLSTTAIADMLRVTLLARYGGVWMDSTMFIKEDFNSKNFEKSYYTLKTGSMQDFSPNISKNRWKTFLLSGNSPLYRFTRDFFFEYYKKFDLQVDYLLIDYIFSIAFEQSEIVKKEMIELEQHNKYLFWLQENIGNSFNKKEWEGIAQDTKVFKTTYKLPEYIYNESGNYYQKLVNYEL